MFPGVPGNRVRLCLSLHFNIDGCDGVLGARDLNVAIIEEDAVLFFGCRISIKALIKKSEVVFNGAGPHSCICIEITKEEALKQYEKYDKLMRERAK
jgi:hypothetical protein